MADLRLVGVHEDGGHLLLSGPDGDIYLLPMDEALRLAVTRSSPRRAAGQNVGNTRMSPREIQSLIRAGSTASDVAEQSGLPLEQVRRYEGPVLAEREYIASQARAVEVAAASPHHDGYRAAFGDEPASLEEMVRHRLAAFGVDTKTLRWDAWRDNTDTWTVSADFELGSARPAASIGEAAPAVWRYHPGRRSLNNANRWAQQLSELEPLDSPVPHRRLSAVADQPFDVEAQSAEAEEDIVAQQDVEQVTAEAETGGLLEMLRSRRGVRLGLDEDGDDELAAMLGAHVPGAHPRDEALYGPSSDTAPVTDDEEPDDEEEPASKDRLRSVPFLKLAPRLDSDVVEHPSSVSEVSTQTREIVLSGAPEPRTPQAQESAAPVDVPGPSDSEVAARLERKASAKPKRSSVPSWDEIVFGTKGD